jgi:hypothetical protein
LIRINAYTKKKSLFHIEYCFYGNSTLKIVVINRVRFLKRKEISPIT